MLAMRKKIAVIILCFILILAIAVGCVLVVQAARDRTAAALDAEYTLATADLTLQRARLQIEYTDIELDALASLPSGSAVALVFTEIDSCLYDTIYSHFGVGRDDLAGVMCFSPDNLPGMEGKITLDQYGIMMDGSWTTGLWWDGTGDLSAYLTEMRDALGKLGIDMPDTIAFATNKYDLDYDEILNKYGISYAVHHGEDKLSLIDTSVRSTVKHPGTVGWNAVNQQRAFHEAVNTAKGVASFTVSFEDSKLSSYFDPADESLYTGFSNMLEYLRENIDAVGVTDFEDAWKMRERYVDGYNALKDGVKARQAEILTQITEIDRRLVEIYNEIYEK